MKKGEKIRVLQMEDYNGADQQATQMNGNIYTVDYVDDVGQIHLQEAGLAVIPEVDKFIIMDSSRYSREVSAIYDVILDYLKFNDNIEDGDGLYLDERGQTYLTTLRAIRGEGEFFPITSLIRHIFVGYTPNVDKIEQMVEKYIDRE